jgi:hypothetical protein
VHKRNAFSVRIRKYEKRDQQGRAAFNERIPQHMTTGKEPSMILNDPKGLEKI